MLTEVVSKINQAVNQGLNNWEKNNTDTKIAEDIEALLNKSKLEIVRKLLGFEQNYSNRWELSNKENGSAISQALGTRLKPIIDSWLDKIEAPRLTKSMEESLKREFEERLKWKVRRNLLDYADNCAKEITEKVKKDLESYLIQETDNFLTLKQILIGETK